MKPRPQRDALRPGPVLFHQAAGVLGGETAEAEGLGFHTESPVILHGDIESEHCAGIEPAFLDQVDHVSQRHRHVGRPVVERQVIVPPLVRDDLMPLSDRRQKKNMDLTPGNDGPLLRLERAGPSAQHPTILQGLRRSSRGSPRDLRQYPPSLVFAKSQSGRKIVVKPHENEGSTLRRSRRKEFATFCEMDGGGAVSPARVGEAVGRYSHHIIDTYATQRRLSWFCQKNKPPSIPLR